MSAPLLLSAAQAGELLGVSESTVNDLVRSDQFPCPDAIRFVGNTRKYSRLVLERWAAGTQETPA